MIPWRDHILTPTAVLVKDPCPLGLQETWTVVHPGRRAPLRIAPREIARRPRCWAQLQALCVGLLAPVIWGLTSFVVILAGFET